MRAHCTVLMFGWLAMMPVTDVGAQALRDARIPFQQPRFDNLRGTQIQLQPIGRENLRQEPLRLTPIQLRSFPNQTIAPPPLQIAPLPRGQFPIENFNLQPLQIAPLRRDVLPLAPLNLPPLNPTPLQIQPLVMPPLTRDPLNLGTIQFDSSILGFSSPLQQTIPSTSTQRPTYTPAPPPNQPRRPTSPAYGRPQKQQSSGRRARQALGW